MSDYKVLFSTNEYTYSISIMDNSTEVVTTTTALSSTTTSTTTTTTTTTTLSSTTTITTTTESTTTTLETTTTQTSTTTTTIMIEEMPEVFEEEESVEEELSSDYGVESSTMVESVNVINIGLKKYMPTLIDDQIMVESTSRSENLITAKPKNLSPNLNAALYIVICLLGFSLLINMILLYVSKRRHNMRSNKLIIAHEICQSKLSNLPGSQRTGSTSSTTECGSESVAECNINLITANGSATSGIDSDHS